MSTKKIKAKNGKPTDNESREQILSLSRQAQALAKELTETRLSEARFKIAAGLYREYIRKHFKVTPPEIEFKHTKAKDGQIQIDARFVDEEAVVPVDPKLTGGKEARRTKSGLIVIGGKDG
jgi:hypothetical protein